MSAAHPQALVEALRAMIVDSNGHELPADAVRSLGGWERIGHQAATLVDDGLLLPLVSLISRDYADADTSAMVALQEMTAAVLSTKSPALFGDALNILANSPAVVEAMGDRLADELLTQASGVHELLDPDEATISRAADALEILTRLKVGGFGTPFALFAFLEKFQGPAPARLATAAIRSIGTAVDHWPEAVSLQEAVKTLAGMKPATLPAWSGADPQDVASDASWVLSGIDLVRALRTDDLAEMVLLLRSSRTYLLTARDTYQREDAEILIDVLDVVSMLLGEPGATPTIAALTDSVLSPEKIDGLIERANRFNVATSGLEHWFGDVKRASVAAWVAFAADLRTLQATLSQESFYRAEVVVDDLLKIYTASRSALVVRRDSDLGGVLQLVQPVVESGFAAKAGLLAHLRQHVQNLEARLGNANDAAQKEIGDELETARDVLAKAENFALRGGELGKGGGGVSIALLPEPLNRLFPAGSREAAEVANLGDAVIERLASAVQNQSIARNLTLVECDIVTTLTSGLVQCSEYKGDVKTAVDELVILLVRFVSDRVNAQSNRKKYLFNADASENDLHQDLYDYLRSTDLGATTEMEVQHVGGGRIDIRISFEGFGLHIELKADDTKTAMTDKTAYLKQAVAYQVTDVRIGFLIALRTKAFDSTGPSPHLTSLFEHTTFEVEGDSLPRHVVLIQVPGNRTAPSKMK